MSIYKNILVSLILISIGFSEITIKGSIYDAKTKEPLIGASIFLQGTSFGTASNLDGSFILKDIPVCPTCEYELKSTYIGYQEFKKKVSAIKDGDIFLDLFLEPTSIEIDETTITAQRRQQKVTDAPAAIEIISASDIKQEETTNIGSYLKGIKGVDFTATGINNYSISVRGFNSSFTTRLLTLTDGRIASIPSLRVINYSTVPQSSKDIDNIEVVLGPSTALYGANAHSGVVNITSKSPVDSQGFDLSVSSSLNDARDLYKISTRWATKLSKNLSIKVSGMHLKANEWEFISEQEYKTHSYPYTGFPGRAIDGKDNNPWVSEFSTPKFVEITDPVTGNLKTVLIGNGEPNDTGDPDQDGVMGEDWFNGFDDDNDGLIDEDYFFADGIDNNGNCTGDTNLDGCVCCGWRDLNGNKIWDEGESNNGDEGVDEGIDTHDDTWFDGADNDGNGAIDDNQEMYTGSEVFPNWSYNLEANEVIVFNGRQEKYIGSEPFVDDGNDQTPAFGNQNSPDFDDDGSESNEEWDYNELFTDYNGDGTWTQGIQNPWYFENNFVNDNRHLRGTHYYDEDAVKMIFDIYTYDFGDDGIAGDNAWVDEEGDGDFLPWEGENLLFGAPISTEPCLENIFFGNGICENVNSGFGSDTFIPSIHDCGLDGICYPNNPELQDYGEGDGQHSTFDWNNDNIYDDGDFWDPNSWANIGNGGMPDENEVEWDDTYPEGNLQYDPPVYINGELIYPGEELLDCGQDGLCPGDSGYNGPDFGEGNGKTFIDSNEMDGVYDVGDGCYGCKAEPYTDINGNGFYDRGEPYTDTNQDGLWTQKDYEDNFQRVNDVNGDGLADYPDFEVKNTKAEVRIDYDPNKDFNLSFQTGYTWSKFQQVTGVGRYIADGYQYTFYQLRARYKNLFTQIYLNQGNSGNTRGYDLGNVIHDKSKNYAFQLQYNFNLSDNYSTPFPFYKVIPNTKIVWGIDLFKTDAYTNGTILGDGPNGYDNNDNALVWDANNQDDDFDSNDFADCGIDGECEYLWSYVSNSFIENTKWNGADEGEGNGVPNIGEPGVRWFDYNEDGVIDYDSEAYIYADGIDNDLDGADFDNDGYLNFHEELFGSDPNDVDDFPWYDFNENGEYDPPEVDNDGNITFEGEQMDPSLANKDWAIDEMIDEKFCYDPTNPTEYVGLVETDMFSGKRGNRLWLCGEGYDEEIEFINVESLEKGFYLQTKTNPYGNKKWEIVTAFRIDEHDRLDEGIQFAPKFGLFYKPSDRHTFRLTYGKAFNTPSAINLHTDLFIRSIGQMDYFLRGNEDGTPYRRVGDDVDLSEGEFSVVPPQIQIGNEYKYIGETEEYWAGNPDENIAPYIERVDGAVYFMAFNDHNLVRVPDYVPLDTNLYTVYVPELTDTGRVYTALEALEISDVDPIKTEKIQTIEFGFKGFLSQRVFATFDYYTSFYEDFFSAPTIITPLIVQRNIQEIKGIYTDITDAEFAIDHVVGLLPINYNTGNAPFATQFNGKDDDNDWSVTVPFPLFENNASPACDVYTCSVVDFNNPIYNTTGEFEDEYFEENGQYITAPGFDWSLSQGGFGWADAGEGVNPGQFGYVDYIRCESDWGKTTSGVVGQEVSCDDFPTNIYGGNPQPGDIIGVTIYQPENVTDYSNGNLTFSSEPGVDLWHPVGIDEYSPIAGGLSEAEMIELGIQDAHGEAIRIPGTAFTPLHSILAPMNYGEVTMSGIDVGLTFLFPEYNFTFDTNFSFYNSTSYYNSLTKKFDPINAPKFKMNASINWRSPIGDIAVKYRHVDQFIWRDGIWSGIIGPYDLFDLFYTLRVNKYLEINLTAQNIFDKVHKEMIGGPYMGRQLIMRLSTSL